MAGVLTRCTVFSLPPRPARTTASLSQPLPQPPLTTTARKPLKLAKRRNHLRPKILKTLAKPYAPIRTPEEPPTGAVIPVPSSETLSDLFEAESLEEEASRISESVGVGPEHGGVEWKFSARSVIKFGAYSVVVFLFQTICAVWVFGSNSSDSASESKERTLVNGEGRAVSGKFSSRIRNVVYLDESDLEKRIEEIRSMAREARRSEKRGLKRDDTGVGESDDGDDDDDDDGEAIPESRTAIKKEIISRLDKLQKKLGPVRKSPGLSNNVPLEGASSLMFKKKLKFRSPLVEKPSANPKGFQRLQDNGKTKKKNSSEVNGEGQNGGLNHGVTESLNGEKWKRVDGNGHGGLSKDIEREGDETMVFTDMQNDLHNDGVGEGQSFTGEDEVGDTRSRTGIVNEASGKRNLFGGANLRKTGNSSLQSSQSFGDEKQEATKRSAGRDVKSINGTLKREEMKATSMNKRVNDKQSDKIQEYWWLKLPCVFAILMRRGTDLEEPGGFFTLKTAPEDSDASSYTVAFEDRVDANNFCFLLESFFEELGDFSADIVPLLRNELQEAMKEKTMKLVVVRKGQLKLYAGQLFSDVELALHSLVKESLSE